MESQQSKTQPTPATERLPVIAELIAIGEIPIPMDWDPECLESLLNLVHIARRRRLVEFVGRVIANDIRREERREETREC